MNNDMQNGLQNILDAMNNLVEPKLENLKYDKTYRAKIISNEGSGIYKVQINGKEYQAKYANSSLSVGEIVKVKAPLNNFSDIYIETLPGTGGGGEENVIETVQENGVPLTVKNKTVNVVAPTNLVNGSTTGSLRSISSTAESGTNVLGKDAVAFGNGTTAPGNGAFAEGTAAYAVGYSSHAEGYSSTSGARAFTVASVLKDSAQYKLKTGDTFWNTGILGMDCLITNDSLNNKEYVGKITSTDSTKFLVTVSDFKEPTWEGEVYLLVGSDFSKGDSYIGGFSAHAEGANTEAVGQYSHAEGYYTKAFSDCQHVQGSYNIFDMENKYLDIVGNGTSTKRSNATTVDTEGNAWYAGNVYVGSTSGTNRDDGSKKLITLDEIPIASSESLGLVKVGSGLGIGTDGTLNVTGGTSGIINEIPIGGVVEYPINGAIPDGWLECDGSVVSRTTYSALFAKIGTEFGEGDGSTTFGLPNMKGRVAVGLDTSDNDFNVIGKTGGEKTHRLNLEELPGDVVAGGTSNKAWAVAAWGDFSGSAYPVTTINNENNQLTHGINYQPHNNLQPYFVTKFIIKAEESSAIVATVVDNLTSTSSTNALSANQGKVLNNKTVNLTPVVLYSNNNGTSGSFTLSSSAENYSRLEIYFRDQEGQHSGTVVCNPDGKRINLDMTVTNSDVAGSWAKIKAITINGANVNVNWYCEASITDSVVQKNNFIYITKVIGFLN